MKKQWKEGEQRKDEEEWEEYSHLHCEEISHVTTSMRDAESSVCLPLPVWPYTIVVYLSLRAIVTDLEFLTIINGFLRLVTDCSSLF